jgi:RNA polymerase sigma-70 factor (ECF subfamily)
MTDRFDGLYERVLVLRCQTGDEAAFAELVGRYAGRLRGFVGRLLPADVGAVEDVLQDVWVDVVRGVGRLAEPGAFTAWVFRIARDRAYLVLRKRRRPVLSLADPGEVPDGAEDAGLDAEEREAVRAGLDALPPGHREVLALRFVEDLSYDQIAVVVGCPVGTVRSRLHHAKRALRAVLEQRGVR